MPFTATQLNTFYTNENLGIAPTAAEALLLQAYASQSQAGVLTDAQTLANVEAFAQDKTDVALATYQFFTGATPTLAGLAFLVHGGGNANDLSSAYYAGFNKENRYYNFAINLALDPASAGAAAFAASYSSLTFAQAVQVAYENIVGTATVGAAGAAAAIASITSSLSFFQAIAASRAPTSNQDLATKAIMIGYILEEAQKADVGIYAKGIDQFESALAQTGTAVTGNLLVNYPPAPPVGQTINLTALPATYTGTPQADTFNGFVNGNATTTTFVAGDVINGNGGADVLNLTDLGSGAVYDLRLIAAATVTGVPTVNVRSTEGVDVNSAAFAGATALNVASSEAFGAQSISAGAATAISVTETSAIAGAAAGGQVAINGGSSVTVNASLTNTSGINTTATEGAVTINGGAGTTSVTVNQDAPVTAAALVTGVADGVVTINDVSAGSATAAGVIGTVTLKNYGAGSAINDNGLVTLNLSGKDGTLTITDSSTTPTATTLALNVTGLSGTNTITDATVKTLNVTTGAASSTLAGFTDAALRTLNISGASTFSMTAFNNAVTSLTLTGAAGLSGTAGAPLDISGAAGLTSFAPTSTGTVNIQLGAAQSFTGGAGKDVITITADATKAITGGTATNNEIVLNNTAATFTAALKTTPSVVTGFQVLGVSAGSTGTFDMSKFPAIHAIDVLATGGSVIFSNVAAGTTLAVDNTITTGVTYITNDATGAADSVAMTLGTATSAGVITGGQVTLEDNTLAGVGTLTITSQGNIAALPFVNTITALNDSGMTSLTLNGAVGTTIATLVDNAATVAITNASGGTVVDTVTAWASSSLTNLTLSGSVVVGLTDTNTTGVTINAGGDAAPVNLNLTGATATHTDNITVGSAAVGTNVVVDAGAGTVNITAGTGANTITTGAGTNTITIGASGTKAESVVTISANQNAINLGAHTGVDNVTVASHTAGVTAVITGLNTGVSSADTITFSSDAGATGTVNALSTTNINSYANAHALDATQFGTAVAAAFDITANGGLNLAQHAIGEFVFQGNTFIVEQANALGTVFGAGDTIVELVGVQTVTALSIGAAGVLSLHG